MPEYSALQRPVSLALGGGGARGLAHVVVLEVLDELGIRVEAISGTSIGAIIGAGYANGLTGRDIRDATIALFSDRSAVLQSLWKLRGDRLLPRLSPTNIDPLLVLETFVGDLIPHQFDELKTPLAIVASDFYGWKEKVFRSGDLRKAVAASIAIPVLFEPVRADGRILVDGGFVNPLPFDHLPADMMTIAVDVTGGPKAPPLQEDQIDVPLPGVRDMLFGSTQLVMQSITNEKLKARRPDVLISPPIEAYGVLDFLKVKEILLATDAERDGIKRQIETQFAR